MQTAQVNLDLLRKLLQNNKEAIKNALELFVDSTEDDMELLSVHIRSGRNVDAARIAHSLKSRFVYLGNEELIHLVKELEHSLKNSAKEDTRQIPDLFYGLNRMIFFCMNQVLEEIKALKAQPTSLA